MRFEQETEIEASLLCDCIPDLGRLGVLVSSLERLLRRAAGAHARRQQAGRRELLEPPNFEVFVRPKVSCQVGRWLELSGTS